MALTGLAIAAALSLAKSKLVDEPAAARQRKLAAATQRYSPWTHMQAQAPQDPNVLGQALQYGGTGAAIGSQLGKGTPDPTKGVTSKAANVGNPYAQGGYAGLDPDDANIAVG